MNRKLFYLLLGSISLAGCASKPFDYEGTARRAAYASFCQREDLITQDEFASYTSFQLGEYADQFTHDSNQLKTRYLDLLDKARRTSINSERERDELKMNCAKIATVAKRVNPNNTAKQQSQSGYQYKPPTTTNCRTVYGWTHCTTN